MEFWGFHYEENHCPDLSEHCKEMTVMVITQ